MACPCCTFYYCHHVPCSKYGRLEIKWAGITTEAIISPAGPPRVFGYVVNRVDRSCTFPVGSVGGVVHGGLYGSLYELIVGFPVVGLFGSRPELAPTCAPSTTTADDFLITGDITTAVAFSISQATGSDQWWIHPSTRWRYEITKDGQTIAKIGQSFKDFRDSGEPYPNTCDDYIDAGNALGDVEPELRLIQTGPGTQCFNTLLESRGFPAISGPHQNAAECEAVCGGPLP